MSTYCPNCSMLTYDENRCEYCGKQIKKINNQKERTNKRKFTPQKIQKDKRIELLIIIPLIIIAISTTYLAFDKYQERYITKEMVKTIFGTDDIDTILNQNKKQLELYRKMTNQLKNIRF